jgi:hypothetical protein
MPYRKAVPLIALLVGAVAAAGITGYLVRRSGHGRQRPAASSATTTAATKHLSPAAAEALASRLRSGDPEQVREAVVLPGGVAPPARFVTELHRLATLRFDTATFRDNGDGTAQVRAEAARAGQAAQAWTAYLVWESNRWKLSTTVPAPASSSSASP